MKHNKLLGFLGAMLLALPLVGCNDKKTAKPTVDPQQQQQEEKEEPTEFTVTWVNFDNKILEKDEKVQKGEMPSYDSSEPTRASDAEYIYTFDKWTPAIAPVKADITYKATFSTVKTLAKIVFDLDGGTSKTGVESLYIDVFNADKFFFDVKKEGLIFRGWSYNGVKVFDSFGNQLVEPEIKDEMVFKAIYSNKAQLVITPNIENAGTVTGAGEYEFNKDVTITAVADKGFDFVGWYHEGSLISTNAKYVLTVWQSDIEIEARFAPNTFVLSVESFNEELGSVKINDGSFDYVPSCSAPFDCHAKVSVSAFNNKDVAFLGWFDEEDNLVCADKFYTFAMPNHDLTLVAKWNAFRLILNSDNAEAGVLSGAGTFKSTESITINATPNKGYAFLGWFDANDELVTTDQSYIVKMGEQDVAYIAKFGLVSYSLVVESEDEVKGSVVGSGTFEYKSGVSVTATPEMGYSFVGWYNGNTKVSDNEVYSFAMPNENTTLVARFTNNFYKLTVVSEGEDKGVVTGEGSYAYGSNVIVTSTPNEGYVFEGWYINGTKVSIEPTYSFAMPYNDLTVEARYTAKNYRVFVSVDKDDIRKGSVSGAGVFAYRSEVTVTSSSVKGFSLEGWYVGDEKVSEDAEYTFSMPHETYVLVAKFKANDYMVNAASEDEVKGTVEGSGAYTYGNKVSVTATANEGYSFAGWYVGSNKVGSYPTYSFTMPYNDVDLVAKFSTNSYKLSASVAREDYAKGKVSGSGTYLYTGEVTVVATPNNGYAFVAWNNGVEDVSTDAEYTFVMPHNDYALVAKFKEVAYKVTVETEEEKGSVTGAGDYDYTSTVTLVATANEGYSFAGWYNGETRVSRDAKLTFTMPYNDVNLVAKFSTNNYRVTTSVARADLRKGSVSEGGIYAFRSNVTVVATANEGYSFEGWYNGEEKVSDQAEFSFEMPYVDVALVAKFSTNSYALTVASEDEVKGTVAESGVIEYGSKVTVVATPNAGYAFEGWYNGEEKVSTHAEYSFVMPHEEVSLVARFTTLTYKVEVVSENPVEGVVSGSGVYTYGDTVKLVATITGEASLKKDIKFTGWFDGSNMVSDQQEFEFAMPHNDITYTAKFESEVYKEVGETVKFGSYPQARVTDSSIVEELNAKAGALPTSRNPRAWSAYKWYVNAEISTSAGYFIDIELNGQKYRGVYFTSYRPYYVENNTSEAGSHQDENGYMKSTVYWFKYEPIEWRIVSNDKGDAVVRAMVILDSAQYATDASAIYPNKYDSSDLRAFLNGDFVKAAFTAEEQERLLTSVVDNSLATTGYEVSKYTCANTNDKVYTMSFADLANPAFALSGDDRKATVTDYAACMGCYVSKDGFGSYWLRSPVGNDPVKARHINYKGEVIDYDSVGMTDIGVIPVLRLK